MPYLKKIFLTTLFVLFSTGAIAAQQVTIYCDDGYPPYAYAENGKAAGIYVTILEKAFARMPEYNVSIIPVPWKRGLGMLESGEGFAIFPPYYHPKKRPYLDYSSPILDEVVIVIMREEVSKSMKRERWPEDFYGLTIGNNSGYQLGGDKFWEAAKQGKLKVDEAPGTESNLLKLGIGRTDCYINDRNAIRVTLSQLKKSGKYDEGGRHAVLVEGPKVSTEQGFLGITNRDNGKFAFKEDFVKKFNLEIEKMQKSGEIDSIIDQLTR